MIYSALQETIRRGRKENVRRGRKEEEEIREAWEEQSERAVIWEAVAVAEPVLYQVGRVTGQESGAGSAGSVKRRLIISIRYGRRGHSDNILYIHQGEFLSRLSRSSGFRGSFFNLKIWFYILKLLLTHLAIAQIKEVSTSLRLTLWNWFHSFMVLA